MRQEEIPTVRFCGRDEWYALLERAHMHPNTKGVAMAMGRFANHVTGQFIFPGEKRLAGAMGRTDRHVREHLDFLREMKILTLVRRHTGQRGVHDEYNLSWPLEVDAVQWRIDGHPPVQLRHLREERRRRHEKEQN